MYPTYTTAAASRPETYPYLLVLLSPMGTPEKSPQFEIRRVEDELDMEVNIGNRFKCWQ